MSDTPEPVGPDAGGAPMGKRERERIARRTRLLDAAELRFAEAGYEGTVLRDVTRLAATRLSSVTEEFGGKEQLFREVLLRRAIPLEQQRFRQLRQIPDDVHGIARLEAIVDAYIDPMLAQAQASDGWRNYFRFIAQLANSRQVVQIVVAGDYNRSVGHFVDAFSGAYPTATDEAAHEGFLLMLSSALEVFAATPRLDSLSGGKFRGTDLARRCVALRVFVTAGLHALFVR